MRPLLHRMHLSSTALIVGAARLVSSAVRSTAKVWALVLVYPVFAVGAPQNIVIQPAAEQPASPPDQWFLILFEDKPAGYERISHSSTSHSSDDNPSLLPQGIPERSSDEAALVRRLRDTRLQLRRFGTDLSVTAVQETLETAEGLVQSWSLRRTAADGGMLERSGRWLAEDSLFEVTEFSQATRRTYRMPVSPQPRSSMMTAWIPEVFVGQLQEGRFPVLFPETAAVVDIQVQRRGSQSLRLRTGNTINVQKIEFWPTIDPARTTTVLIDDQNVAVRSEQPLLGSTLILERCDAATALGNGGLSAIDLDLTALVPVNRPIPSPEHRSRTRLRLTVPVPGQITLPSSRFQTVERNAANDLTVTLIRPGSTLSQNSPGASSPASSFLQPTELLNFQSFDVQRVARAAVGGATDPEEVCRQLTRYLAANLRRSPFSTSLLSAEETARQMRGDCTEHAILLAALMRSFQVPSRIVVGLRYQERIPAFSAHMWTEAFVRGVWMPFDSTIGSNTAFPVSIKVLDSRLDDPQATSVAIFLPMLDLVGRARLELLPDGEP